MSSVQQRILKCMSDMIVTFKALCAAISKGTRTLTGDSTKSKAQVAMIKNEIMLQTELLIEKDKELKTLLRELVENQKFQRKIDQTKQILDEKEYKISKLTESLETVHSKLGNSLHQSSPIVKSIKESKNLSLDDVFSYSHFISKVTSEQIALKEAEMQLAPFPVPEMWHLSLLYPNTLRLYKTKYTETINAEKEQEEHKVPRIDFDKFQYEHNVAVPTTQKAKISLFGDDSDDSDDSDD